MLTILGFLLIAATVGLIMWFAVCRLRMDHSYWLVPILGAAGGAVGSLLKSQQKEDEEGWYNFRLCSLVPPSSISAGILGDIVVGIGGATAAVFLFGGTLKFKPGETDTYVLLVSVSFIAGVVGKKIVETASQRLLNEVRDVAKGVASKVASEKVKLPMAMAAMESAKQLFNAGKYREAAEELDKVIKASPTYIPAYIVKGRALKKLKQYKEALAIVNQALAMRPSEAGFESEMPTLLYNRACYKALNGSPLPDILADLKQAISKDPKAKQDAETDDDFASIWGEKEFQDL